MGEAFITRRGGIGSEQALAPTITEVSTTATSITFTITNNDASTAVILYEVNDTTPDANSIELAAAATSGSLTISGLSPGTVDLYATANVTGKVKSNVTEKEFTLVDPFTAATGGTTAEYDSSGKRFRSHTFTTSGTFTVTNVGETADDRNKVDYLIVAGGAGGGGQDAGARGGGGGGAGGYRTTNGTSGANASAESKVTVTAATFGVTIGAGGAGGSPELAGANGVASSALGILTVGGGGGGRSGTSGTNNGNSGGSGGGGADFAGTGGAGTSAQGFAGGNQQSTNVNSGGAGSGGGGASAAGGQGFPGSTGGAAGNGGNGLANLLRTGLNETRAGGGGGGGFILDELPGTGGIGGGGTGGGGSTQVNATPGTANTGGGGGGGGTDSPVFSRFTSSAGGSGIVVIRYEIATV